MSDLLKNNIRFMFDKEEAKLLLINPYIEPNDYWYKINKESFIPSTGFCYLASEVYYQLTGKAKEWWFKELKAHPDLPFNGYHYFLQNKHTDEIVDLTKDQFNGIVNEIPYHDAKNKGIRFMSKNCKKFIELMNKET